MSERNIERLYNVAYRNIHTITGSLDYGRVTDALIRLCEVVAETDTDESTWWIGGDSGEALSDLIVGAYWHYVHYHRGQDSKEYLALSVLGTIYRPGMEWEPEGFNDPGFNTCDLLGRMAENQAKEDALAKEQQRSRIDALIAEKKDEQLKNLSIEELEALRNK